MLAQRHAFGWRKDPFNPDALLHSALKTRVAVPSLANLSALLPSVRHQGDVGSCVGFGVGALVGTVASQLGIFSEWYSPTWIYNGARYLEGTLALDIGAVPDDAFRWLTMSGNLFEQFWPYNKDKLDTTVPSSERASKAIKYPDWRVIRADIGVDGLKEALAPGVDDTEHCVAIGSPWFDKWMDDALEGALCEVTENDSVAGGHETLLYGYDDAARVFFGQNSWGTDWGARLDGSRGRFTLPYSAIPIFKKLGGYDAHYVEFNPSNIPAPKPRHQSVICDFVVYVTRYGKHRRLLNALERRPTC